MESKNYNKEMLKQKSLCLFETTPILLLWVNNDIISNIIKMINFFNQNPSKA